jgi:hypothetical protein
VHLNDLQTKQEKIGYSYENYCDCSPRQGFIVQKYMEGKFIKGKRVVDPWSLAPLKDVEWAVLELGIERPQDYNDYDQ